MDTTGPLMSTWSHPITLCVKKNSENISKHLTNYYILTEFQHRKKKKVVKKLSKLSKSCQKFHNTWKKKPVKIWQNWLKSSFLQQCAKSAQKMLKNRQMLLYVTTMRKKSQPNAEKRDFLLKNVTFGPGKKYRIVFCILRPDATKSHLVIID
jgi:hypothetical protein